MRIFTEILIIILIYEGDQKNMAKRDNDKTTKLSAKSEALLEMLTNRGLVEDQKINDGKVRQTAKDKKRRMFHNTELLLQNYRDIVWMFECFPESIAEELDKPLKNIDVLLSAVNDEIDLDNRKLENRLKSITKSRLLIDRVNEALTVLKKKPSHGELMYNIIYNTYIIPEKLSHIDLVYNLSDRHYYRMRRQAINILALRLWATPGGELDSWIEVLAILENL